MVQTYIPRTLELALLKAAREFPAVVLTGSRQSGKTTLLKHLFAKHYRYVSLEPLDIWSMDLSQSSQVSSITPSGFKVIVR